MKKHLRLVSLILTLTVLMLSIVSCGDLGEDLPDQNGTDDQNINYKHPGNRDERGRHNQSSGN